MFQIWIEKSISAELNDELYCLCNETDILAFCSLKYKGNAASIGLFGVNISYQDKELGSQILKRIFQLLYKRRITELDIITQGNNIGALHLYQKSGFYISKITMSYYRWVQ
jgi:ribosomal protein S18 acetylase RimI-like enzyme